MTDPAYPSPPSPPADDSRVASIAWAVATIVVALVIGLIAWLAMGDRGGDTEAAAPTTPSSASPSQSQGPDDAAGEGAGSPAETPGTEGGAEQAQTPPPEVKAMMLDLQRRDADDPMAVGSVDAPVVMIEYADYRCPYCAKFHLDIRPELGDLVEDGTLRIEFRDLVLFEEQSQQAAIAARAAAAQDKLADYQRALFARSTQGHAELTRADLVAIAQEVGVADLGAFETSLDDEHLAELVNADSAEARALGISSTPTFLINTAVVQGAYEAEHMRAVIDAELQTAKAEQQS